MNTNNNTLRMPIKQASPVALQTQQPTVRHTDEVMASYKTMLGVMRRMYDLWGDPAVKEVIDAAEGALARR